MSKPVFLLIYEFRFSEAWHQLTKKQQRDLWTKVNKVDDRAGGKWIILCDSRWANENSGSWGVIEYPDMDRYQQKVDELEKLDWWRFVSCKTILGTKAPELS